jgi:1,4-dihydroxy-2-naphthoate octaprenyltransferase
LFCVLFLQAAMNVWNDVEDHLRLIDLPGASGGSGVIQKGWISAKKLQRWGVSFFILGVLFGLPGVIQNLSVLIWIAGGAGLAVLAYSGRPFGMKYRLGGDLLPLLLAGPLLTLGFSEVVFSQRDSGILFIGAAFGFFASTLFHVGNLQDIEKDLSMGERSLATDLGFKRSRIFLAVLYGAALSSIGMGVVSGSLPRILLLAMTCSLPPVFLILKKVFRASGPISIHLARIRTEALHAYFDFGTLIFLVLVFSVKLI